MKKRKKERKRGVEGGDGAKEKGGRTGILKDGDGEEKEMEEEGEEENFWGRRQSEKEKEEEN